MRAAMKINHFRLWQISNDDELHQWLSKALLQTAQYLEVKEPTSSLDLLRAMSFDEAIKSLCHRVSLASMAVGEILDASMMYVPMLARDKRTNKPVLLLPYEHESSLLYQGGDGKKINHQQITQHLDSFVVLFLGTRQDSYAYVTKLVCSYFPVAPLVLWSLSALVSGSAFVLGSFLLLSDYGEDNSIPFTLLALFSMVMLLVLMKKRHFWSIKNYWLARLVLINDLYQRLFFLPIATLKQINPLEIGTWVASIRHSLQVFFTERIIYVFALMVVAITLLLSLIFTGLFGLVLLLSVIGFFILAHHLHQRESNIAKIRQQCHEDLHSDLERFRVTLCTMPELHASSGLVLRTLIKQERLIFLENQYDTRNFARNEGIFFLPILGVLAALCLMMLSFWSLALWQTVLLMFLGLIFGLTYGFLCQKISHVSFSVMNRQIKKVFEQWPLIPLGTHVEPKGIRGGIEVVNVSFNYAARSQLVIKNLSFVIQAKKFHVIYGASLSGKSTLINLLMGELSPTSGQVIIDGQDVRSLNRSSLRSHFGVVLEDARLFAGTVLENILCGRSIPEKSLERLLLSHEIFDRLLDLPMGLNTYVYGHLKNLARLETVLVLLLRALAHGPKILFMDELLDGLNKEQQDIILSYLAELTITKILTCHKKTDAGNADHYICIDQAEIIN
jgi:ABC-type multidrug transport system fused ATPase/permease subunit